MLIVMIIFIIIIISLLLVLGFETPAAHSGLWHPVVPVGDGDFLPLVFLSNKVNPQVRWTLQKSIYNFAKQAWTAFIYSTPKCGLRFFFNPAL